MPRTMNRALLHLNIAGALVGLLVGLTALAAPKYAKDVIPLSSFHKYIETHPAPDFWRLAPYYVPQFNGAACSAASFAMVINGAKSKGPMSSDMKLVTQASLADQLKDQFWGKAIQGASSLTQDELIARFKTGELKRSPILMSEYDSVVRPLFEKNGLKVVETKWLHVKDTKPETRKAVRDLLIENEKSDNDFIVLDMVQGDLTGDPEGMVGHVAVVGAFDADKNRVLVMDPDREWYEPYWTTLDRVLAATVKLEKPSNEHHGLYHIKYELKK